VSELSDFAVPLAASSPCESTYPPVGDLERHVHVLLDQQHPGAGGRRVLADDRQQAADDDRLEFGKVIAEGPPEVVRKDPKVIGAYLGDDMTDAALTGTTADSPEGFSADQNLTTVISNGP
jgi:hypothetical protein